MAQVKEEVGKRYKARELRVKPQPKEAYEEAPEKPVRGRPQSSPHSPVDVLLGCTKCRYLAVCGTHSGVLSMWEELKPP